MELSDAIGMVREQLVAAQVGVGRWRRAVIDLRCGEGVDPVQRRGQKGRRRAIAATAYRPAPDEEMAPLKARPSIMVWWLRRSERVIAARWVGPGPWR